MIIVGVAVIAMIHFIAKKVGRDWGTNTVKCDSTCFYLRWNTVAGDMGRNEETISDTLFSEQGHSL